MSFLRRPTGESIQLQNLYSGMSCFISGTGPSLNTLDLSLLNAPGIMTMGINNAWSKVPVDIMVCQDPPGRFLGWGWMNPRIMKLCPFSRRNDFIRTKNKRGEFVEIGLTPSDTPNTYLFERDLRFNPRTFLDHKSLNWGCTNGKGQKCGKSRSFKDQNTLISTFQIAHYFGFQKVFLIGVDFTMSEDQPYAFEQSKNPKACSNNNHSYKRIINQVRAIKPRLENDGMEIFNCNKESRLDCFEHISYEDAVDYAKLWEKEDSVYWYNWKDDPKNKYEAKEKDGNIKTFYKKVEKN